MKASVSRCQQQILLNIIPCQGSVKEKPFFNFSLSEMILKRIVVRLPCQKPHSSVEMIVKENFG
jgi:hypothetical protein